MSLNRDQPLEYLVGHLEDILARDPRVNEQGLRVRIVDGPPAIVVSGTVVSQGSRAALAVVIGEMLPGIAVRDETTSADYPESDEREELS